jgi:hypothetical protein
MMRAAPAPTERVASTYGIATTLSALARDARDDRHRDRGDDVADRALPCAESRDHRDRDDDQRETDENVHEALDKLVDPAAEVGADHAENIPGRAADERSGKPDEQGGARAVDDAREDVATEVVRPQEMGWARGHEEVGEADLHGVIRGDYVREGRGEDHHEDEDRAGGPQRTPAYEVDHEPPEAPSATIGEKSLPRELLGLVCDDGHEYRIRGSMTT